MRVLERTLEGDPSFTVLFGASAVGKVCGFLLGTLRFHSENLILAHVDGSSP